MKRALYHLTLIFLVASSCGNRDVDPLAASGRTQRTENLLASLKEIAAEGKFFFGHHDDTVYGVGWVDEEGRSDVLSVCGDYPALLGMDLGGLEMGKDRNLDGVEGGKLREEIVKHFERGGVITLSWHCNNPLSGRHAWVTDETREAESHTVEQILAEGQTHETFLVWLDRIARFLKSLKTPDGIRVPVILRPWHEHTGSWFWWGQNNCTKEQFIDLWQLTVNRLREKGVVNALYAYSTGLEAGGDPEKFMERYPGDDYIDLLGLDFYCSSPVSEADACGQYLAKAYKNIPMLCALAKEHHKAAAITETGYEGIKTADWWTATLLPAIEQYPLSYVMVWRNAYDKEGHFYAPYPGHPSCDDFVSFYKREKTLFATDLNHLYESQR